MSADRKYAWNLNLTHWFNKERTDVFWIASAAFFFGGNIAGVANFVLVLERGKVLPRQIPAFSVTAQNSVIRGRSTLEALRVHVLEILFKFCRYFLVITVFTITKAVLPGWNITLYVPCPPQPLLVATQIFGYFYDRPRSGQAWTFNFHATCKGRKISVNC